MKLKKIEGNNNKEWISIKWANHREKAISPKVSSLKRSIIFISSYTDE